MYQFLLLAAVAVVALFMVALVGVGAVFNTIRRSLLLLEHLILLL
jgi:hypothetical protein